MYISSSSNISIILYLLLHNFWLLYRTITSWYSYLIFCIIYINDTIIVTVCIVAFPTTVTDFC